MSASATCISEVPQTNVFCNESNIHWPLVIGSRASVAVKRCGQTTDGVVRIIKITPCFQISVRRATDHLGESNSML